METTVYKYGQAFICSEVVSREAMAKYCREHNLPVPQVGIPWTISCSTKLQNIIHAFGNYGDNWDGKSNQFITQKRIDSWKKFLLIPEDNYQEFFGLTPYERENIWSDFRRERASDDFWHQLIDNQANDVDHFRNNPDGERLLLLRRLSRIYVDDMFMNYAGSKMLNHIGDAEQTNFYQRWGKDGLKFNGHENEYLSQQEIDQEREELGIADEEFTRFYTLDYGQRFLLFESRFFY